MNPCQGWSVIDPVVLQPMFQHTTRTVFFPVGGIFQQVAPSNSNRTGIAFVGQVGISFELSIVKPPSMGLSPIYAPQTLVDFNIQTDGGVTFGEWFAATLSPPGVIVVIEQFFYPCR